MNQLSFIKLFSLNVLNCNSYWDNHYYQSAYILFTVFWENLGDSALAVVGFEQRINIDESSRDTLLKIDKAT